MWRVNGHTFTFFCIYYFTMYPNEVGPVCLDLFQKLPDKNLSQQLVTNNLLLLFETFKLIDNRICLFLFFMLMN